MWGVWVIGTLETEMVSVERIEEYTNTTPEVDTYLIKRGSIPT